MKKKEESLTAMLVKVLILCLFIVGAAYGFIEARNCVRSLTDFTVKAPEIDVHSSAAADLTNSSFWAIAESSFRDEIVSILPHTVMGFVDDFQGWRELAMQQFPDPPVWVPTGFVSYAHGMLVKLRYNATQSNNPMTAAMYVRSFGGSVAGTSLALLDFVTFNGLTSLRTLFGTGDSGAAVCVSFPGQLGTLYSQAFDPSLPKNVRAQYLGKAIAITTVLTALSGGRGFASEFRSALDRVGLSDAWDQVKPYFSKLGGISARAAQLTFTVLEKLSARFPSDSRWVAGLTTDRIESMAEVLHGKGFSSEQIGQRIGTLVQAADNPAGEDDVATDADVISYRDGGSLFVRLGSEHQMYLYSDKGTMQFVKASFLETVVPGFKALQPTLLRVYYVGSDAVSYHSYEGGKIFWATVPDGIGKPGDFFDVKIQLLTRDDFVKFIPKFSLVNEAHFSFLPDFVEIDGATLTGNDLTLAMTQDPPIEGISNFAVRGHASGSLIPAPGKGIYLQFDITDVFGQTRSLRLYHDGNSLPWFTIEGGEKFPGVTFIAWDGVRLRIPYGGATQNVATIYLEDPSGLYSVGNMIEKSLDFEVSGVSGVFRVFQIDPVGLLRDTENRMLSSNSAYPHGRLGAEIAYVVAKQKLGLNDVVLLDPSKGGADLFTKDGKVVIEARMLTRTEGLSGKELQDELAVQLKQMVGRLDWDLKPQNNPLAQTGYAVLSYVDVVNNQPVLKTIVLEVPKP